MFTSVLVVGELRHGIELKRRKDEPSARDLEGWLDSIVDAYRRRILPIDGRTADLWARLNVPHPLPAVDSLIAATALVHGLTVVTGNRRDYARPGVSVLVPFERRAKA